MTSVSILTVGRREIESLQETVSQLKENQAELNENLELRSRQLRLVMYAVEDLKAALFAEEKIPPVETEASTAQEGDEQNKSSSSEQASNKSSRPLATETESEEHSRRKRARVESPTAEQVGS